MSHHACSKCGQLKPRTKEYWPSDRSCSDGLRATCRDCRNKQKRDNYHERSKDPAFRTRHNEINLNWARRTGYDRKRNKTIGRRLQRNLAEHRRRQRKHRNGGDCSTEQFALIFQGQGERCFWCETTLTVNAAQMDHLMPIKRGGSNAPWNIVAACNRCNAKKGSMTAEEYIQKLREEEIVNVECEVVPLLRQLAAISRDPNNEHPKPRRAHI